MIAIFAINVYLHRPVVDSFLFALALAVGLTPELLPAIVSLTFARGAQQMAASQAIVRRLNSIEDFGRVNVLCCDKTGTLTEGVVRLHAALDAGDFRRPTRQIPYFDLPTGAAFMTAQIAAHEVVYSIILEPTEQPFSRVGVEDRFIYELRPISN